MTTKDRTYRSSAGIAGGVLLLAIVLWLGIDALFQGEDRTPWLALAAMILVVPLIVAFTLRPAVFADDDRLRVRNPFRIVVLPWGQVASLASGYSNEVIAASGTKFQLWALPVSLRDRKKATRRIAKAERGERAGGRAGGLGLGLSGGPAPDEGPARAKNDKVMDDLRELAETRGNAESAQGEVTVRWAYEIFGPALAGAVLLAILLATG
ncbi:PH domain-containing protein [Streptomyces sp. S.PB5]|uniref:PH domain-containing protein n=1 Tax=Streptomyces sp. S.PB5 TaxID=3020844 RepID=UPI0025AF0E55|nr:PH domain-containing protein [Streptomyces sp. S.PB5]MDN3024394.1 PH domain-containing protein [Streptomyces sp. S.PB5]